MEEELQTGIPTNEEGLPQRLSIQGVAAVMEPPAIAGSTRVSVDIQKTIARAETVAQIHRGTNVTVTSPAMVRDRLPLPLPVHVFVIAKH